jgi:acrylyl-CoA reductase (NADPH)
MCPKRDRELAWKRLEEDLDRGRLADMTSVIGLGEVIDAAGNIVGGRIRGRIAVRIS